MQSPSATASPARRPGNAKVRHGAPRGQSWRPEPLASLLAAAELLTADLLAGELTTRHLRTIARQVTERASLPTGTVLPALHALVARDTRLISSEPTAATRSQLTALHLFAPVEHASLWLIDKGEQLCVARVGTNPQIRRLRSVVRRAVTTNEPTTAAGPNGPLHGFPVRSAEAGGALVVESTERAAGRALQFASETASVLASVIDRLLPADQASIASAQLLHAADRRVTRISLDIHDGPLQGLSLLLSELSTFDRQLELLVSDDGPRGILERRIADLTAIASSVNGDLREIAAAGGRAGSSLLDSLERAVSLLERHGGVTVRLSVEGDVERTTASQRIAVARVVEEALANVREHSRATEVDVLVRRDEGSLRVSVRDNGIGFHVARANQRAARERRLGLAVMGERARLLGGRFRVDSRPGGSTSISAVLPAWESAPGASG